jgi:hypothetical protein
MVLASAFILASRNAAKRAYLLSECGLTATNEKFSACARADFRFCHFIFRFFRAEFRHINREGHMDKEDAIEVMSHLADRLDNGVEIEDVVSAYAEFLAHINPSVNDEDFAFLATIGAMIYQKGARRYDSGLQTTELMAKLRQAA